MLKLVGFNQLKRIIIGDDSFGKVRRFGLIGMNALEKIEIGKRSFTTSRANGSTIYFDRKDGVLRIINCPKLESIDIGDESFSDYQIFELDNLPLLQSLQIDDWCFSIASFSLIGMLDARMISNRFS